MTGHLNCSDCPSYNGGRYSRGCIPCPKYKDILPAYKPGPSIVSVSAEIIDGYPTMILSDSLLNAMLALDPLEQTLLVQNKTFNWTQEEIAYFFKTVKPPSQQTVSNIVKRAAINVREILRDSGKI